MIRTILSILAFLTLLTWTIGGDAARVAPMVVDIQPIGRESVARVQLTNTSEGRFPVEVRMFRGDIGENGELDLVPAEDDFLVFPAQAILEGASQQVFRVQYIGEPELAQSEVYYMSIRQIPVELAPGEPQVQIVVNFNVLVNVIPEGTEADPIVESVAAAVRDDVPGIEVRIGNRGTRYFAAGDARWTISGTAPDGSAETVRIEPAEMARSIGVGIVPPGRARVFFVPISEQLQENPVTVTMN